MHMPSWGNHCTTIALFIACLVALWDRRTYAFRIRSTGLVTPKAPTNHIANHLFVAPEVDSSGSGAVATQTQSNSRRLQPANDERYNKHPRFCLGSYRLFNLEVNECMDKPSLLKLKAMFPYIYLLTRCDIVLESMGKARIAGLDLGGGRGQCAEHAMNSPEDSVDHPFGPDFTDKSLSVIRALYDPELRTHMPEDFLNLLESKDIGTFEVNDLISETREGGATRGELRRFMRETALGGVDLGKKLQDIAQGSWDYLPSDQNVRVSFSFFDAPGKLVVNFRLLPFTKPLVLSNMTVKSVTSAPSGSRKPQAARQQTIGLACGKVRPTVNAALKPRAASHSESSKIKMIKIGGGLRRSFNELFQVLQSLNPGSEAAGQRLDPDPEGPAPPRRMFPLLIKAMGVYLNSQPQFMLPLLTFVDMRERRAYLCNRSIPIPAVPAAVWDPFTTTYGRFNAAFVPEDYRHAAFFSSAGLLFRDAELLRALATFPGFVRLVHGLCNPGAEAAAPAPPDFSVTFKKLGPSGDEARDEDDRADVYEVNERFKMVYKNNDKDLLVNLLA